MINPSGSTSSGGGSFAGILERTFMLTTHLLTNAHIHVSICAYVLYCRHAHYILILHLVVYTPIYTVHIILILLLYLKLLPVYY